MARIIFALVIACLLPVSVLAEVYKYVDKNGNVYYTDTPRDYSAERLNVRSAPTDPARVRAAQDALLEQRRQEAFQREEADKASAQAEQDAQVAKQNCDTARRNLDYAVSASRVFEVLPGGERRYLSAEEIDQRIDEARAKVTEYCERA